MIYEATPKDFLGILAQNANAVFLFYAKEHKGTVAMKKIRKQLDEVVATNSEINIHIFVTDETTEAEQFSSVLEIDALPTLVVYKNGSFSRYKNKEFTAASIRKFIGSSKKKAPLEAEV